MTATLISRYGNHDGLGYQALIVDWMNWLIMENPDANNDNIVVYFRGVDFNPDPMTGLYRSFIRAGANRYIISPEQAVFWPVIMYFIDQNHHQNANTPVQRLGHLTNLMNASPDKPPRADQALISENGGQLAPIRAAGYANHRFVSDIDFELQIPQQDYSNRTSLCTLLDVPLTRPGPTKCRVGGYFLLLTFTPGTYNSDFTALFIRYRR